MALESISNVAHRKPLGYKLLLDNPNAADLNIQQLSGNFAHNAYSLRYKAKWHKYVGYPTSECIDSLKFGLVDCALKLAGSIFPAGYKDDILSESGAKCTRPESVRALSVANVGPHVSAPVLIIAELSNLTANIGTSIYHMLPGTEENSALGLCGIVKGEILRGFHGYKACQFRSGDHFKWFIGNYVPEEFCFQIKNLSSDHTVNYN